MSVNRARKDAARVLGLEFQRRYAALVTAGNEDEVTTAAVELGGLFNDNIEFVIWALKKVGGLDGPAPEPKLRTENNVPKMPAALVGRLNEGTAYL